jgi:hypothetical protein
MPVTSATLAKDKTDKSPAIQGRNAEFVQSWTGEAVEVMREQTEHNARTAEAFARAVGRQQEGFRTLARGWARAYGDLFSPLAYAREGMGAFQRATRQGLETTEQIARQGLRATEKTTRQGLRVAEDATERTDKVLRQSAPLPSAPSAPPPSPPSPARSLRNPGTWRTCHPP